MKNSKFSLGLYQKVVQLFLVLLISSNCISQINPWKNNSTNNPWESEKSITKNQKDTLNIQKQTSSTIDSSSNVINKDLITYSEIDSSKIDSLRSTKNVLLKIEDLKKIQFESRANFNATGSFVGSFITGGVFMIFALPVNVIATEIPGGKENQYINDYKINHPNYSPDEIKYVKKGVRSKKIGKAIGGTFAGMATGIAIWLIAFTI